MRCKVWCSFKSQDSISFTPVYSGSEENKQFFLATPGGFITLNVVNQVTLSRFEVGKEYYLDFSPA